MELTRWFCEAGARKDTMHPFGGHTALNLAAQLGRLDAVQYLCEAGADKDKALMNGATPPLSPRTLSAERHGIVDSTQSRASERRISSKYAGIRSFFKSSTV